MGAPRGALEVAPDVWPVEEEPVREYCFLRLRGRSFPPLVGLEVGGAVEEPEPAAGAVEDDPADRDAARSAVGCRCPLRPICGPDIFLEEEGACLKECHGRA